MKGLCIGGHFDGTEQDWDGGPSVHIARIPAPPIPLDFSGKWEEIAAGQSRTEAYRFEKLCCGPGAGLFSFWIRTDVTLAEAFRRLVASYQKKT